VSFKYSANSALSATDRYLCCLKRLSKAINWALVNGVLGLRSFFCFLSLIGLPDDGGGIGGGVLPAAGQRKNN